MKKTNWYVIQVMTGSEETMCQNIQQIMETDCYERCFVPMAEVRMKQNGKYVTAEKPLFPGYLFIITDAAEKVQAALWKVAKFKRLLSAGGTASALTEQEVSAFHSFSDENYRVSLSKGFIEGDQIVITEGPLKGQEGLIRKIDRHKRFALVEMPFLGKTTNVRVPLEVADKI